jgi:ceramide glucosyltransferase
MDVLSDYSTFINSIRSLAAAILFCFCLTSIVFYFYSLYAASCFFQEKTLHNANFHPSVTILKPLRGLDSHTYDNLLSFCHQDYPNFQVVFTVRDHNDPVIAITEQIINQFPDLAIDLVISDYTIGHNLKVSNLHNALKKTKHDILVIADSDIRVKSDYLQKVVQPLCDPQVGVVTCLYNSLTQGYISAFESLAIATEFHPRVLTARKLEGMKFAFGSTIVIRRQVLEEIGGFSAIADYLADDYKLGNLPYKQGYQVQLSSYIVQHTLEDVNIHNFIDRQIRWFKCIKNERFWGYLGLIFTSGTANSLLFLLIVLGEKIGWLMLSLTWGIRLIIAWIFGILFFKDPSVKKMFILIPLRDLVSFSIWFYSLFGNKVRWREETFILLGKGKLNRITEVENIT